MNQNHPIAIKCTLCKAMCSQTDRVGVGGLWQKILRSLSPPLPPPPPALFCDWPLVLTPLPLLFCDWLVVSPRHFLRLLLLRRWHLSKTIACSKHCQRHNGPKALSTLTHSIPSVQSKSFTKLWNLGQTSACFCLANSIQKHCQWHNGPKALSTLTHSTP